MPALYDPKALSDALELDYFTRPRPLNRVLRRLTWVAGAAAALFVAWALWPTNHKTLQAGPLAMRHAMFNHDCGVCHQSPFATATRLWPDGAAQSSVPDQACLQCHPAADHGSMSAEKTCFVKAENCTTCHKEHRGQELLVRPSDRHCTECHDNLKERFPSCTFENVISFGAHPEFALWRSGGASDQGNVEFSHQKHLGLRTEELVKSSGSPETLAVIGAEMVKLRQMQCSYCHQPDAGGKYMQPILFDQHCQKCHPLQVHIRQDPLPDPLKAAAVDFNRRPVPHPSKGQSAWNVRAAVRERYLQFSQENAKLLLLKVLPHEELLVLPGLAARQPTTASQLDWVNGQWRHAESLFFDNSSGCALCHADVSKKNYDESGIPLFATPKLPARWFEHGIFSHHTHRMLDCAACHEGATKSDSRADVMMPKLTNCQSCHQAKSGLARSDCVECHQFHKLADATPWREKFTLPKGK